MAHQYQPVDNISSLNSSDDTARVDTLFLKREGT